MPFNQLNYGDVVSNIENVKSARSTRQNAELKSQGDRIDANIARQLEVTKMANAANAEMMQDPSSAVRWNPILIEAGYLKPGTDLVSMHPTKLRVQAKKHYESTKKALKAFSASQRNAKKTAGIIEYEYGEGLPGDKQETYKDVIHANRKAKFVDSGDNIVAYDPITVKELGRVDKELAPPQELKYLEDAEKRKVVGKFEGKKIADRAKNLARTKGKAGQTALLKKLIAKAKGQSSWLSTGFVGNLTEGWAQTPAHNLSQTLTTIKAAIGFGKLEELKTLTAQGGALGPVSDFENRLLQAVWGALAQSQHGPQFEENLDNVLEQVIESWERIEEAYFMDYGIAYSEAGPHRKDLPQGYQGGYADSQEDLQDNQTGQAAPQEDLESEYERLKAKYPIR